MGLDLRIPLGLMFLSIGIMMLVYGVFTWNDAMYARSLGININVLWGGAMTLFGTTMFLLGSRSRRLDKVSAGGPVEGAAPRGRSGH